jgi:hypothetical protein
MEEKHLPLRILRSGLVLTQFNDRTAIQAFSILFVRFPCALMEAEVSLSSE